MMARHATMTCDEFLDRAAAVALDAVEDDEADRVEEHAAECLQCARHLQEFREVAAAMGSAVSQVVPPAALRDKVLKTARHTPRHLALRQLWAKRMRGVRIAPAWLVAAASLLFSFGALVWAAQLQFQVRALQVDASAARERATRYDNVAQILTSDKLAVRPLRPALQTMASRGMAYMDPSSGTGMVMCHNLPPVEQGHVYQVWFVRGNERVSGGLLWPDPDGNGYTLIQVPADLMSFDSVGLTDEPGTGSSRPTSPQVIRTPLREAAQ